MKKLNKKGFTLVELLAVIVVLALLVIIVFPIVLNAMNRARDNTLRLFAQNAILNAEAEMEVRRMEGTFRHTCFNLTDLGMDTTGNYVGTVIALITDDFNILYKAYISDHRWGIWGLTSSAIERVVFEPNANRRFAGNAPFACCCHHPNSVDAAWHINNQNTPDHTRNAPMAYHTNCPVNFPSGFPNNECGT